MLTYLSDTYSEWTTGAGRYVKQRAGDRGITAEDMEKSQHTDFNADTTNESASVVTGVARGAWGVGRTGRHLIGAANGRKLLLKIQTKIQIV